MVTKTFTFEGKRYYVRAQDEDQAKLKAALRLRDLQEGRRGITQNMPVSAWAKEWLEVYKKPSVNPKQYKDIKAVVDNFITPDIGTMQIKNVRPVHLQKIMVGTTEYSDSYISQRRPITQLERKLTLEVAETYRGGTFVLIMLYCGLRPGEVAALTWANVDLKKNVIHVRQALKSDGTVKLPKTSAGYRDVPIPKVLADRLKKEKRTSMLVCPNSEGGMYTSSSMQRMFRVYKNKMNKAAGCKTFKGKVLPPFAVGDDLTLYCYRHTYGTDLQAAGVPINVAKELMGHENISVTAQIYTHKSEAAFNNAADLINAYVAQGVAPKAESVEKSVFGS